jgi:hypothetical protein
MRRPWWVGAGVLLGVGGTLWAEQRVKKGVAQITERLTAENLANEARRSVTRFGARARSAVEVGREERSRRERELWDDLGRRPSPPEVPWSNGQGAAGPDNTRTWGAQGGRRAHQ